MQVVPFTLPILPATLNPCPEIPFLEECGTSGPLRRPMDRKNETFHYHIRWLGGALDWEAWSTRAAAEYSARQIAQPGETYVLEESRGACMTCVSISLPRR